ncbi:MAG TPA: methionyl-tRNA formyltransferase [Candidatus Paceibacterota bacterium]|jgi:methionyl-tRNA formyltransferase|nr:methionyl-tRNA formyltransferase [Candidatus Paceibacterota bacterium]
MNYRYVFFGTPHIAELTLEELEKQNFLPGLIVTAPARPQGRGMHLTDTPVAQFAHAHNIPVLTPEKITPDFIAELQKHGPWDFYFVVAYGKILPQSLLDSVNGKVLNLHPSLLPKYRGPSPLESVLLSDDTETGVSIMELDREVDHGPIVTQASFVLPEEETVTSLTQKSAVLGTQCLTENIAAYLDGSLSPIVQDHELSTHTKKYVKADGSLDGIADDWQKWKIFRALGDRGWVHFSTEHHGKTITVKITNAAYKDDAFVIEEVIPENGKRQSYETYLHSFN